MQFRLNYWHACTRCLVYYIFTAATQCTTYSNNMVDKTVLFPHQAFHKINWDMWFENGILLFKYTNNPFNVDANTGQITALVYFHLAELFCPSGKWRNLHLSMEHTSRLLDVEPNLPIWHPPLEVVRTNHCSLWGTCQKHGLPMLLRWKRSHFAVLYLLNILQCYDVYNSTMSVPWPLCCLVT